MKLLIVEDEIELQSSIAEGLRMDGYAVDTCDNGKTACELCFVESYDLVILDLNLPEMDGFHVLQHIREFNKDQKILILSARNSVLDKVYGLDHGANDYLTKPFDFQELEARIRNLLRRNYTLQDNILTFDKLKMDISKRAVYIDDKEIRFTKKEVSILEYFLLHPNKIISQEELMSHIWDSNVNCFSGAIRVHIASLRKKIKQILQYDVIHTKIGEGYYLKKEDVL